MNDLRARSLIASMLLATLCFTGMGRAQTQVACVGDSITFGAGLRPSEAYPAKLQYLLGRDYVVQNFGVSATTLLKAGDRPYENTTAYVNSHGNPIPPDIVVIMLGTNDSKPLNWRFGANFILDYQDLIAGYTNLPSAPRVLICTPLPVFDDGAFDISPLIVANEIVPAIRQIGLNTGVEVADLFTAFLGHGEWSYDTVHPNDTGTTVMAAAVCSAIFRSLENDAPRLEIAGVTTSLILEWPAHSAGWLLQSAPALAGASEWTLLGRRPTHSGDSVRQILPMSAPTTVYRLWQPLAR